MTRDWKQLASEGITVFRASRLEALLEPLDHLLASQAPASPLQPQAVVAAHPGMRQWLAGALARRRGTGGIVANLDIVLPSTFLDGLAGDLLGDRAVSPRAWRRESLRWHLHALLENPSDPALQAALAGGESALRRFQLADRLARIYTQYMAYRPDWLRDWAAGRRAFAEAGFHPALWRALRQRLGADTRHRGERLVALAESLRGASQVPDAGQPLHVFGLSHLAPTELAVLQSLAVRRPVVLYVPDPCREFWAGLDTRQDRLRALARDPHGDDSEAFFLAQTHPLLAAWGRLGQHFMLQVQDLEARLDIRHFRDEAGADTEPVTRLDRLQESLRRLQPALAATDPRPPSERRADASLRVHACHTRLRELEVLHDALLRARADDPSIEPSDIVVMAPDIGAYVPLLPAVFGPPGDTGSELPYHLADIPSTRASSLLTAFRRLLALPVSRLTAPELLDFIAQPDVARRLGLDDGLDSLARWLAGARAAWGLDPDFRAAVGVPAREHNTMAWAMDRLVTSHIFGDEAAEPVHRFPDQSAVAPVPGVMGAAATALGAFDHLLQQVAMLRADAAAMLPASAWARRLEERVDAMFQENPDDAGEREAMASLRALLRALANEPREAGLDPPLPFPVVRRWLEEKLDAVPARQRFLAGGITVCGMVPQRAIPFRVVAVLGLNEGDYPRADVDAGLDPIRRPGQRRLGDRDTRSDDRYLFLETVMSARDRLHLSYVGRDVHDGRARNPASPLAELMAALPPGADGNAPEWCVQHPLQPFDPRYFDGADPALFTFDAGRAGMTGGQPDPPRLLSVTPAAPDDMAMDAPLDALRRYFRDPARHLLAERLRARLDALEDDALAEDEPLEAKLDPLDRAAKGLCLAALSDPSVDLDEMPPEHLVLGGVLPAGALGARAWRAEADAAKQLVAKAQARADAATLFQPVLAPVLEAPAIRRQLGRFRITGELPGVRERDGTLWVFEAFPHRDSEDALRLGERIGLFLPWVLLRLAPENARRRVRICALLPGGGSAWQDQVNGEDEAFFAADGELRELLAQGLAARAKVLVDAWARPVAHSPWYFPRTSSEALAGGDVEAAWRAERAYAPGYARLLGRGLQMGPGEDDAQRLVEEASVLAEAIGYQPEAE